MKKPGDQFTAPVTRTAKPGRKRRKMSAKSRAKIAATQNWCGVILKLNAMPALESLSWLDAFLNFRTHDFFAGHEYFGAIKDALA
jgi:hypothetical protein